MSEEGASTEESRWSNLLAFVEKWRTPLEPGDGISAQELDATENRLGLQLPVALREWYLMAGKRDDLVRRQNQLIPPHKLHFADDKLVFMVENQDVVAWGSKLADLNQPDPAVFLARDYCDRQSNYDWIQENPSISSFVYQMIVLETTIGGEHSGWSLVGEGCVAKIEHHFKSLGFPDWHWPNYPNRIYGDRDTLLTVAPNGELSDVYITALTEETLLRTLDFLEIVLERY